MLLLLRSLLHSSSSSSSLESKLYCSAPGSKFKYSMEPSSMVNLNLESGASRCNLDLDFRQFYYIFTCNWDWRFQVTRKFTCNLDKTSNIRGSFATTVNLDKISNILMIVNS